MKTNVVLIASALVVNLLLALPGFAQVRETAKVDPRAHLTGSHRTVVVQHQHHFRQREPLRPRPVPPARHNEQARLAEWYAGTATGQARRAWRLGCATDHPRWSTSWDDHFRWAYGSRSDRILQEIETRDRALAGCRGYRR